MQRADKRKFHYIYKITRDDGRYYVGMHSTDVLEDGYFGSGKLITRSIKKHGIERHTKEILEFLDSRLLLKTRESELVNEELIADKLCMNLQLGGGGGFIDEYHQLKCAAAGGRIGGKTAIQIITRDKSFREKALATKQKNGTFYTQGMLNKLHSDEAKQKMSLAGSGEKNSQFGSCWVTDGVKPIKIKKEQLDEYLAKGFIRGRIGG